MTSFNISAGAHGFGDGQHPTTRGMLTAMGGIDASVFSPRIACDMGAGSGILALAIARQWACPVVAVDMDARAVETLRANAAQNGVTLGVLYGKPSILPLRAEGFAHPDIAAHAPYDLIVANILAEPLLSLAGAATMHLASGGALIISGLLQWQEATLREAYTALGLELASRIVIGDWVTLGWGKP